jgi:fructokinase
LDVVLGDFQSREAGIYAGGTCGNVLSILSHFGWGAKAIGYVGQDIPGSRVLADLGQIGVDCAFLIAHEAIRTPVFLQQLTSVGGRPAHSFLHECPACGEVLVREYEKSLPLQHFEVGNAPDVLFLDRLSDAALELARSAHACGSLVMYEPSVGTDRAYWRAALPLVDILKYSSERFAAGDFNAVLVDDCAFWEIQTAGEEGLRYRRRDSSQSVRDWIHLPAVEAVSVIDACGAGDWCSAGLLKELVASGVEWRTIGDEQVLAALRAGQAWAAWACGFAGARGAMYAGSHDSRIASTHDFLVATLCGRPDCHTSRRSNYR